MTDTRRDFSFDMDYAQAYKTPEGKLHVVGIASDSAEDRTGDRMSDRAISSMVKQAKENKLSLLDNHRATFGFGHTHDAWVKKVQNGDKTVTQFHVDFELDDRYPQSMDLFREVSSGKPTKQLSIGGFLNLENPKAVKFEDGPKGRRIRVLDDLVLEHIATTRPGQAAVPRTKFVDAVIKDCFGGEPTTEEVPIVAADPIVVNEPRKTVPPQTDGQPVAKTAVPYRAYPALRGAAWSWNSAASNAVLGDGNWDRYKAAHAWIEDTDGTTPQLKTAYKLPHHTLVDGALVTHERGVIAAMAALLGARGGTNIPAADRSAVYNHLARHYRDLDREPPELRDYSADEFNRYHEAMGFDMKGLDMSASATPTAAPEAPITTANDTNKAASQSATPAAASSLIATINAEAVSKGLEVLGRIAKTFDPPAPPAEPIEITALVKAWDAVKAAGLVEKSGDSIRKIRQAMSKLLGEPEPAPETTEKSVSAAQIEQIVAKALTGLPNNNAEVVRQFGVSFEALAQELAKGLVGMADGFKMLVEKQTAGINGRLDSIEKTSGERLSKLEAAAGVRQSAPQQDNQVVIGQTPTGQTPQNTVVNKDAGGQVRQPDAANPYRGLFDKARLAYMASRR